MANTDKIFSGPIAMIYDDYMGPIFFEPFARDLAQRIAAFSPQDDSGNCSRQRHLDRSYRKSRAGGAKSRPPISTKP